MLLLGHIGITAFVAFMLFLPALGAIVGALLPDVIDKGLFELGMAPCSRFLAHSVFFFPVAGLVTYGITRNKKLAIAVALGAFLHLLEDLHDPIPFLFPLKTYSFFETCTSIHITFMPYLIITETGGGILTIFVFGFRKSIIKLRNILWSIVHKVI